MKNHTFIFLIILSVLFGSCQSYKQVPYLQNSNSIHPPAQTPVLYDAKIMPKDLLTIVVNSSEPELATPFNLTIATPATVNSRNTTTQASLQTYLVDNRGYIDFPVLGKIKLGGLTKSEAESTIKQQLLAYLTEEPIVTVRMVNYKISVIGEVARPNTFTIANEKVNLFEALAMAGDMTIYGRRDNVKLIREDIEGRQKIVELNLNNTDIVSSPYYYLQQNDILYVTPNKVKAKTADISTSTTIWVSLTSVLVSVAGLLVNILR